MKAPKNSVASVSGLGWLAAMLLCAASCAGRARPSHLAQAPDGAAGVGAGALDPASLLDALRARAARLRSLRGEGRVVSRGKEGRLKGSVVVACERPAKLRLELLSFFGQPTEVMVSDGLDFQYWSVKEARFLFGPAAPHNLGRLVPVEWAGEDLVSLLLGGPPLPPAAQARSTKLAKLEDGSVRVELADTSSNAPARPAVRRMLVIDPALAAATRAAAYDASGEPLYTVSFDDFESVSTGTSAVSLAKTIRVEVPRNGVDLTLRYKSVTVNGAVDPNLFVLAPPPGLRPEYVP